MKAAWSLRKRLSRGVLGMVGIAWALTILLALVFLDYETNEMLDEELEALAETVVLSLDATSGGAISRVISIGAGKGERILRILPEGAQVPDEPWSALQADGFHTREGWRILRVSAEHAVIELAHNMAWRREELFEAASAFVVLILPLAALLLWLIGGHLRRVLRPLERLAESIASRKPADLEPIAARDLPEELQPLLTEMNRYLSRIADLRLSERQFVANASHELRTPLAAIRAGLELSEDAEAKAALPRIDALARRVERLLQLSRSQSGLGLGRGPSDLVQILQLLQRETSVKAAEGFRFDDGDFEHFPLAHDPDALAIVLRNLIENAQEHGRGPVWVRLRQGELRIRNAVTMGDLPEFRPAAPFSKGKTSSGMGLGLSIVAELCAAMGITLTKRLEDGYFEVILIFSGQDPVIG